MQNTVFMLDENGGPMKTLVQNCHLISPGVDRKDVALLIDGNRIEAVLPPDVEAPETSSVFDAEGQYVVPGLIEIHSHGAMGYDVTDGTVEAIEAIAKAKLAEGVTTYLPTTLTLPEAQLAAALRAVASYKENEKYAKVPGVHLEGPYINPKSIGAQNPDYVRAPDIDEVMRLHAIMKVCLITFAVEVDGGMDFLKALRKADIVASCGHSAATYAQAMMAREAGLSHLTHFCNQMSPLHHREVGLVGSALLDDEFLIEMICDKVHLSPEMIRLAFKVKPLEHIALITDSVSASGLEDGEYTLGGMKVRVEDGVCRIAQTGALAGSTLRSYQALKNVFDLTDIPLSDLIRTTSLNQALSLGLEGLGKLEPGYAADLAVLGDDFAPQAVFVNGERRL